MTKSLNSLIKVLFVDMTLLFYLFLFLMYKYKIIIL